MPYPTPPNLVPYQPKAVPSLLDGGSYSVQLEIIEDYLNRLGAYVDTQISIATDAAAAAQASAQAAQEAAEEATSAAGTASSVAAHALSTAGQALSLADDANANATAAKEAADAATAAVAGLTTRLTAVEAKAAANEANLAAVVAALLTVSYRGTGALFEGLTVTGGTVTSPALTAIAAEIDDIQSTSGDVSTVVGRLTEQVSGVTEQVSGISGEVDTLSQQVTANETSISELGDSVNAVSGEVTNVVANLNNISVGDDKLISGLTTTAGGAPASPAAVGIQAEAASASTMAQEALTDAETANQAIGERGMIHGTIFDFLNNVAKSKFSVHLPNKINESGDGVTNYSTMYGFNYSGELTDSQTTASEYLFNILSNILLAAPNDDHESVFGWLGSNTRAFTDAPIVQSSAALTVAYESGPEVSLPAQNPASDPVLTSGELAGRVHKTADGSWAYVSAT